MNLGFAEIGGLYAYGLLSKKAKKGNRKRLAIDVCYILSFGFAARTVLHTDVIPELRKQGKTVAAICPGANDLVLQEQAQRIGTMLQPAPLTNKWFKAEYLAMRRYLFENVRRNPALWARHLREVETGGFSRRWQRRVLLAVNQVLCRFSPARNMLAAFEAVMIRNRTARQVLRTIKPRLVVATYPVNALEADFLSEAKRLGIPTAVQLLSWDNITSKGRFPVIADYYLSWGPVMSAELYEYYQIISDRVFETGVAHFDAHLKLLDPVLREGLLASMGLPPDQPYLLFGMSSPYFAPHEIDIVEALARVVRQNKFGVRLNLVVRPHPLNVSGNMADESWLPRLQALRGERVGVHWPKLHKSDMAWAFQEGDLGDLVNLMAGCAINLNSGSTFGIDGLAQGKPVIMTFFDADLQVPWHLSARRGADFIHLKKLLDMNGIFAVYSYTELYGTIRQLLNEPDTRIVERKDSLFAYCSSIDGCASERIAKALQKILNKFN